MNVETVTVWPLVMVPLNERKKPLVNWMSMVVAAPVDEFRSEKVSGLSMVFAPASPVAASVVQSAAKPASHAANAVLKAAQSAPRAMPVRMHAKAAKPVLKASPANRALTVSPVAKAVAAVTAVTVAQTATAHLVTLPRKNSLWPTRPPWPPLHAVTCRHPKPAAKSASHANPVKRVAMAAANAVAAATSVATKRQPPRAAPPPWVTSARPTCALSA